MGVAGIFNRTFTLIKEREKKHPKNNLNYDLNQQMGLSLSLSEKDEFDFLLIISFGS